MPQVSDSPAHERFRRRETRSYWGGLLVAVALHFALFAFAPGMTVDGMGGQLRGDEFNVVNPVPPIPPPPPDREIPRPQGPPVGVGDLPDDVTYEQWDFNDPPPLPPVPPVAEGNERLFEATPRDVEPSLRNGAAIQRLLVRSYPPLVRDAGIGGSVTLLIYVDDTGSVLETRLRESSGVAALDQAAMAVAAEMRFRPAQYRGRSVPVWVAQRIEFTTR